MPTWMLKGCLVAALVLIAVSIVAAVATGDSVYLEGAVGVSFAAVLVALGLRAQRSEAGEQPALASDERLSDYVATTLVSLSSAVVIAVIYPWRLDSIGTVPVLFFVLWLLFMASAYGIKLTRARRSARSLRDRT